MPVDDVNDDDSIAETNGHPDTQRPSKNDCVMRHSTLNNRTNGASSLMNSQALPKSSTLSSVRTLSAEFGHTKTYANFPISEDNTANGGTLSPPQWSSAVGKANLGKSGRVIERLMGENDMLKRELQIERLRAEESKKDVNMAQSKMAQMQSEYDGRLHEASVNKTLLKRRERQLADAKAQIDGEKHKADAAVERERGWREAMEETERKTKLEVEKATSFALMMEGRNTALTSHWKDQGAMVESSVKKLGAEISALNLERKQDFERMNSLQDVCNQQSAMLTALGAEKNAIAEAFSNYKAAQESLLKDVKQHMADQEKANEEKLAETQRVLGELKWALGVKTNVKGAG